MRGCAPLAIAALLTGACGGDDDAFDGVISLSFDGSECEQVSPDEVPAGDIEFQLVNDHDELAWFLVLKHVQDQPISEAIDYWGPDGSEIDNAPGWTSSIVAVSVVAGDQRTLPDVLRPGTFHTACLVEGDSWASWFGGGFVVPE